MNLHLWLTFLIATFCICGAPGPNMLQVMASSAAHGFRRSMFTMAGCFLAVVILIGASVAGVGVLLKASPLLFDILRYAGALYLIYLGMQAWRAPVSIQTPGDEAEGRIVLPSTIFRKGFLVGLSNPKALLFAAAFFPQFIDPHAPELPQLVLLLATVSMMEIGWYIVYAMGGSRLAVIMKQVNVRSAFQRFSGVVFMLFGMLLAVKSS